MEPCGGGGSSVTMLAVWPGLPRQAIIMFPMPKHNSSAHKFKDYRLS